MTHSATEPLTGPGSVCPDPDCVDEQGNPSPAEPETDGDTGYHACTRCGYLFGWHTTRAPYPGDSCAVGIPEAVRRAASPPRALPLLTIGRRHD